MKKSSTILLSKLTINKNFRFVFSAFLALSLFLSFDARVKVIWILFSILFIILLIGSPVYILFGISIFIIAFGIQWLIGSSPIHNQIDGDYEVKNEISMGPIVKINGEKVLIKIHKDIHIHDIVHIKGDITQPVNNSDFDLVTYLKTMNIGNIVVRPHIDLIESSSDLRTSALKYLSSGGPNYRKIAPLMVLGKKTMESKEIYKMAFKMSIIHLFVISGFHISLFFLIVSKILSWMKITENITYIIALLPILVYLFLLNFPISATRAGALIFFGVINKVFLKKRFSTLNILSFTMLVMFLMNPNSIYSLSFIFTFIATYVVIYINTLEFKTDTRKYLAIAIGAYTSNVFISIYTNGWLSIFGVFFGALLSPVFVITYSLSLFLFPIKDLMEYIYTAFNFILNSVNSLNVVVDITKPSLWLIQLIYLLPFSYLIIRKIWNLFMVKNNTLLIKK